MKCFGQKIRNYHCKIVLLDNTELLQEIQDSTRGQALLDVVFRHLNLIETAYFGLRFIDNTGQTHWLDPTKSVPKQLKGTDPFTLYFGVKFYACDPCKLLEEITRYQFFLQVKQDILQGRLPVSFDLAAELFAFAVQSELGDHDPRRNHPGYISEFRFLPHQTGELESKVAELHKGLVGQVPSTAELNFLERVKWLDMYGVDLHPVLGEDNVEYFLGLTPSGVIVLRNKTKVGNYFWPRITKVYFKGRYFMLRVRDKSNEESTYGFELPTKQACKHLWKCCVEHHAFFRLTQVQDVTTPTGKVFGFSSRFRYSGRTEKQAQLDVRQRIRAPPTVVRVPSRRYQKRLGQPDGADAGTDIREESYKENGFSDIKSTLSLSQSVLLPSALYRSTSVPSALPLSDSPKSTRSAPWENPKQRGLYSSSCNPSPRSVRSASSRFNLYRRTSSVESDCSYDSRRRRHHRSRKGSDNESELSKSSRGSRCSKASRSGSHSSRKHRSSRDSGSDSDSRHRHKHHRRNKSGSTYELIDSEAQWREVQRKQQEKSFSRPQAAVVRDLTNNRRSGYMNSGMETESETNYHHRKKHRRHRSRSKSPDNKKVLPEEVKRHIDYDLIDPMDLPEEERRDIRYTKVETDSRLFKIRYSPTSGKPRYKISRLPSKNSLNDLKSKNNCDEEDGPPPPYSPNPLNSNHNSPKTTVTPVSLSSSSQQVNGNNLNNSASSGSTVSNWMMSGMSTSFPRSSTSNLLNDGYSFRSPIVKIPSILSKSQTKLDGGSSTNGSAFSHHEKMNGNSSNDQKPHNISRLTNGGLSMNGDSYMNMPPANSPRVTFQSHPTTTYFNKDVYGSDEQWTKASHNPCPGEIESSSANNHEMSTEL